MPAPLPTGFTLLRTLNDTGAGAVHAATEDSTGALRAVKVFDPTRLGAHPRSNQLYVTGSYHGVSYDSGAPTGVPVINADSFEVGAMATNGVHEAIVPVLATGIEPTTRMPWIASPFIEGETLASRIASGGALGPDELCAVAAPIFAAVGALHAHARMHGGLSAAKVMLTRDGVRLLDAGGFYLRQQGAADRLWWRRQKMLPMPPCASTGPALPLPLPPPPAPRSAHAATPPETPTWWPVDPSIATRALTRWSDVWSLGLLVFHMVSGQAAVRRAGPPRSGRDPLDAWIDRCLAPDVMGRFPDAREAWAALEPVLRSSA